MQEYKFTATAFTRPADTTAYTSGDLVANSTTAASVVPLKFTVNTGTRIQRAGIVLSDATNTNASFRLHLYSSSPTCATNHGDNASWSTTASGYIGSIDVDCTTRAFTDFVTGVGNSISGGVPLEVGSGVIYGLLEARAAYTPTSAETFTVTLYGECQ